LAALQAEQVAHIVLYLQLYAETPELNAHYGSTGRFAGQNQGI
jgi:hypothetical protein